MLCSVQLCGSGLPIVEVSIVSLTRFFCATAGFQVQNALCVRPFPHQRGHPGDRHPGGDQELPGREVHSPCPNEAW